MTRSSATPHFSGDLETSPKDGALAAAMLAGTADAVLGLDGDGRVTFANPAAERMFDRAASRILGSRLSDLVVRQERKTVVGLERQAANGPHSFETRVEGDGKGERIVAVTLAPLRLANGASGAVVVLRDVTEKRQAYDELARSELRYRHLFEGTSDAIMTFDALGRFTTVNNAGEVISGYRRDELIGKFFGPLLALESLPKAVMAFRNALAGNSGQFETILVRRDGERRNITVTYACPQKSREVLCLIRDATEEKQLEQQLIQSEKMAAIGQLVSGVAHELNNPLASISAFGQLLLTERTLSPTQRHSVDVIVGEGRRAARIVHNLLTFARQHKAEKIAANINKVLEDTLELRAYELTVRGIGLVRELDERMPETMIDVYQLQQVLLNLITNAEQAMRDIDRPSHRLTVRTRALRESIRLEVEDTGTGVPPESLALIFNPFYTTKPTGEGTGLGLSISLGIIGEHGGRIWAENVAGSGTRFCIELPVMMPAPRVSGEVLAPIAEPRPGLRILVTDDEPNIRQAIERYLTSQGHSVATAGSGREALGMVEGGDTFDVVLLDMRMPDISGQLIFEQWTRERPELTQRVIFLTGDIVSTDLQDFLTRTGRPYLPKPFEFDAILQLLPQRTPA